MSPSPFKKFLDFNFRLEMLALICVFIGMIYYSFGKDKVLEENDKRKKIAAVLEQDPNAYVGDDGQVQMLPKRTVENPSAKDEEKSTNAGTSQEAFFSNTARNMDAAGFSATDTEALLHHLKTELANPGPLSINLAIANAASELNFSAAKREKMQESVMKSFHDASGGISLDGWNQCLDQDIETYKPNACQLELIENFRRWINDHAEGNMISYQLGNDSYPLTADLTRKFVKECQGEYEMAAIFFSTPTNKNCSKVK